MIPPVLKDLHPLILLVLVFFIWLRDLSWVSSSDDTVPILVALPLFFWIGTPWKWSDDPKKIPELKLICSSLLFLIGIAFNSTIMLAIGWVYYFWSWLVARLKDEELSKVKKLLILPFMAFPWVALDADRIGWWFRLSGAWVASKLFYLLGFDVVLEGTLLIVNGIHIFVEVACAGLNTLQSMLIAGSAVLFLTLGNTSRYWWNLPFLVLMSWIANTIRIFFISLAGVLISPQFAMGDFHVWGGWALLMLMFVLCWLFFSWQKPKEEK